MKNKPELPLDFLSNVPLNKEDQLLLVQALEEDTPTAIRLHPLKKGFVLPLDAQKIPWCRGGYFLTNRPAYTEDPLFHAGAYYPQEASSMFVDFLIQHLPNLPNKVLDFCAAPGGKSTLILSALQQHGLLIANEIIPKRNQILQENCTKWGYNNVVVTQNQSKDFTKIKDFFDLLIVDAPCSGEGMFRKDWNARLEWSKDNVYQCSFRQLEIVKDLMECAQDSAWCFYSTCTFNELENEQVIRNIAEEFNISGLNLELPDSWGIQKTQFNNLYSYRFYPHLTKGEGFCIIPFKVHKNNKPYREIKKNKSSITTHKITPKELQLNSTTGVYQHQNQAFIFPKNHLPSLLHLQQHLYLRKVGLKIGEIIKDQFKFEHDIAMGVDIQQQFPTIALDLITALQYLSKQNISIESPNQGWHIFTYQDLAIGMAKKIQHRWNNYYPTNYRIKHLVLD